MSHAGGGWPSVLAALAVCSAVALMPEPALGAGPLPLHPRYHNLTKILAPGKDAVEHGRDVRVVLRVKRSARRFQVFMSGKRVTKRFHRASRNRFVAHVRSRPGRHSLYVRARGRGGRRDFDARSFVVARPSERLLGVTRRAHGQLSVRARLGRAPRRLRIVLNGHRVAPSEIRAPSRRVRVARLGADDGLRYGRNRVVVRVVSGNGRADVDVLHRTIHRTRPIAGAGPSRTATVRDPVRLDGRSSRSRSGRLRYRWRILAAPPGSHAALVRRRSPTPRLRPDVNGVYRLGLTVTDSRGRSARDRVRVLATPPTPPIGVPISTIPGPGKGVTIDGKEQKVTGNWVQIVVYDRRTRAIDSALSMTLSTSDDPGKLGSILDKVAPTQSVILTGGDRQVSLHHKHFHALRAAIKRIGGTGRTFEKSKPDRGLGTGAWSVLGSKGFSKGSAVQSFGPVVEPGVAHGGSLDGFLQLDSRTPPQYAFAWGDYVPFHVSGDSVTIGDDTYRSDGSLGSTNEGFHLVVLDQNTLQPYFNLTYNTKPKGIAAMGSELRSIVSSELPLLVVVQSINKPHQKTDAWNRELTSWIAIPDGSRDATSSLGGTTQVFNLLDGSGDYALVGGTKLAGYAGAETLQKLTGSATLNGVLSRNRQGQFVAQTWSPYKVDPSLFLLAYQAQTPWPASSTPGLRAATTYFAQQLDLPDTADIRRNYIDVPGRSWNALAQRLNNPAQGDYVACPDKPRGFTAEDCGAVRKQLIAEFQDVTSVVKMIGDLKNTFASDQTAGIVNIADLAHHVETAISPPPPKVGGESRVNWLDIAEGVMHMAGVVPGVEVISGLVVGALTIVSAIEPAESGPEAGQPITNEIETDADDLAARLATVYGEAQQDLGHLRDILVSDWGKLQVAARKHDRGTWDPTSTVNQNALINGFDLSTKRVAFGAILPLAYMVYGLGDRDNRTGSAGDHKAQDFAFCVGAYELRYQPFAKAGRNDQFRAVPRYVHVSPPSPKYGAYAPRYEPHVLGITKKVFEYNGAAKGTVPPASLIAPLFRDPAADPPGGLGLDKPTFFGRHFGFQQASCTTSSKPPVQH